MGVERGKGDRSLEFFEKETWGCENIQNLLQPHGATAVQHFDAWRHL